MKIYKITSPNTDLVYVGKTIQPLSYRFSTHCSEHKRYLADTPSYCSSYKVLECGDATIELIEETDDARREAYWIGELNACNHNKMTVDRSDPEQSTAYLRDWHKANKADQNEKCRKRYQACKEQLKEKAHCSNCGKLSRIDHMKRHKRSKACLNYQSP